MEVQCRIHESRRNAESGQSIDHLSLWVAHYIYTTLSVQYKRLFELAQSQRNQSHAPYERPFWRIDRNRRSGQDTGGFALAVG
ncbi:transposase [Pseudomonas sp. IT-196MI5]